MNSTNEEVRRIRNEIAEQFEVIRVQIVDNPSLQRSIKRLSLELNESPEFLACVSPSVFPDTFTIELSDGLITKLYELIRDNTEEILTAVLPDDVGERSLTKESILNHVLDFAQQFVLNHEILHVLCGHLSQSASNATGRDFALGINESIPVEPLDTTADRDNALLISYCFEMEADSSALQWMLSRTLYGALIEDFQTWSGVDRARLQQSSIDEFPLELKILAFRIVLVSVWLVINLIEVERNQDAPSDTMSHPLPAARLFSVLGTLMTSFLRLGDVRAKPDGKQFARVEDKEAKHIEVFLTEIVAKVCSALANTPNSATVSRLAMRPTQSDNASSAITVIVGDLIAMLANQTPRTTGAGQLEAMEALRPEIAELLSGERYIEEML